MTEDRFSGGKLVNLNVVGIVSQECKTTRFLEINPNTVRSFESCLSGNGNGPSVDSVPRDHQRGLSD